MDSRSTVKPGLGSRDGNLIASNFAQWSLMLLSVWQRVSRSRQFQPPNDLDGERLRNALARAGGRRFLAYKTLITLQRGDQIDRALLSAIAWQPDQNIRTATSSL